MKKQKKSDIVKRFIANRCTHTAGKWRGEPFVLLDWQNEVIEKVFDTLKPDGTRQYRIVYMELPKKNGKTEFIAALSLFMLTSDGEKGAEVYSAASDTDQAALIYRAAQTMVNADMKLQERLDVLPGYRLMADHKNGGRFKVLSSESKTKHGLNPSCVLIDELHGFDNDELYNVLTSGTDYAREQQLVFIITTAGVYNPESIWWRVRDHAIKVRDGIIEDPAFLPILYIADQHNDDPSDEEVWKRVNPSLGQIFTIDKIRDDYNRVKDNPIEFNNFLRYRLNIPAASLSQWVPLDKWDACGGVVDEEKLKGRVCYSGLDLSSTTDLTALVHVFPPESDGDKYEIVCRYFVPEGNIMDRSKKDRVPYDIWVQEGYIKATPGTSVDYNFIIRQLMDDAEKFDIKELAFDRWGSAKIIADLQEAGFEEESNKYAQRHLIAFGQGYKSMSSPTKHLLGLIFEQQINHGNNPVLRWNANNVYADVDPAEGMKPNKGKSTDRIDGIVALIMGLDRCIRNDNEDKSVYEDRGLMVL